MYQIELDPLVLGAPAFLMCSRQGEAQPRDSALERLRKQQEEAWIASISQRERASLRTGR